MFGFGKKKQKREMEKAFERRILEISIDAQLDSIAKWNEETFPDATLGGQLEKLEEELKEASETTTNKDFTKELADVFIVLGGLRRWNSKVGNYHQNATLEGMPNPMMAKLLIAIIEKMEINRKRVWKKSGDGKFHHTEGKE